MLYKERNFYCGKQAEGLIHFYYDVLLAPDCIVEHTMFFALARFLLALSSSVVA